MQTDIRDLSAVKKRIEVRLAPEFVKQEMDSGFVKLQRGVTLKGFRKGHAPMAMVRQKYQQAVEDEVVSDLIQRSLREVLQKQEVHPVAYPVLEEKDLADGLKFAVTIEVKPKLEIRGYQDLKLKREKVEPKKAEIDKVLQQLREQQAVLKDKKVTQPQKGDYAAISVELQVGGKPYKEAAIKERMVPVGEDYLLPELDKTLVEMEVGEKRQVSVDFPKEHADKKLAGKKVLCELTLHAIKEKLLPALDDALAKASGRAATLKELKEKVATDLRTEGSRMQQQQIEQQALDAILSANPFEVPPTLVKHRMQYLMQQLIRAGVQPQNEAEFKKMEEQGYERAVSEVRSDLAIEAIARQEKISVAESEVEAHIEALINNSGRGGQSGKQNDKLKQVLSTEHQRAAIHEQLLRRKVLAFILSSATIKETANK